MIDYIDKSHIFSLKMVKYYKREVFIMQKYKKYLVNSRKSRNFAPQFAKIGVLNTFLAKSKNFNNNILIKVV